MLIPQPLPWSPAPGREIADGHGNVVQYTDANLGLICLAVNQNDRMTKTLMQIEDWLRSSPATRVPDAEILALVSKTTGRVGYDVLALQIEELTQGSPVHDRLLSSELQVPQAAYTGSIDLSLSLLPLGWTFAFSMGEKIDPVSTSPVSMNQVEMTSPAGQLAKGLGHTIPLAVCAAALRARTILKDK